MRRIQHVANPRKFVAIAGTSGLVSPPATHTCGWLTHGRFLFFARAKKRNQKKARPGSRTDPALRGFGARRCPDASSCRGGAVAHIPVRDPFGAHAQSLTVLACAIRG